MKKSYFLLLTALSFVAHNGLRAQSLAADPALELRAGLTDAVRGGTVTLDAALARLHASNAPAGPRFAAAHADFAYAAVDIGHRLLAAKKPVEAERFFREAEAAFAAMVRTMPAAQAREKAQYLQTLAFIRAEYLNQPAQAAADINEAIRLQPADSALAKEGTMIVRGRPEAAAARQPIGAEGRP